MRGKMIAGAALTVLTALAAPAAAVSTVSYTSNTVPLTSTNFSSSLGLQMFDPALGVLQSVRIALTGNVDGTVRVESMDGAPAAIQTTLAATLTLSRPNAGAAIVVTLPMITNGFTASAFDGGLDFGGTSGRTWANVSASATNAVTLTSAADLAAFTGTGMMIAPLVGVGSSTASGAGNLLASFQTRAGGTAEITYSYISTVSAVPEAGTWMMMIAGFGLVGWVLRRRPPVRA